jgi:Flp pilus assembly protein TadG
VDEVDQMEQTTTRQKKAVGRRPGQTARQPKSAESGQTLLEFALMVPFMMLLLLGIAEIGRAAFITITVTNAATAGAEYGSQDSGLAKGTAGAAAMELKAQCDANGYTSDLVPVCQTTTGILAPPSTVCAYNACTCDNGAGTSCNLIAWPPPGTGACTAMTDTCAAISCSGQIVNCVHVNTHADFNPLFHYPGLPTTYQANGKATMRVRQP